MAWRNQRKRKSTTIVATAFILLVRTVDGALKLNPSSSASRRCLGQTLGNHSETNRQGILELIHRNTTCGTCSGMPPGTITKEKGDASGKKIKSDKLQYHVSVFLIHPSPKLVSLASSLLTEGLKVTILSLQPSGINSTTLGGSNRPGSASWIEEQVLSRVPCHIELEKQLNVVDVANATKCTTVGCWGPCVSPLDPCTLDSARNTLDVLNKIFDQVHRLEEIDSIGDDEDVSAFLPDVLVMDAAFTAGLLLSEIWKIPTITVSSHNVLALSVEHDGDCTPPGWNIFYRIYRILKQRWYSLSLTGSILNLNRIRRDLGLSPLRAPTAYFAPVVAVVVEFARQDIMWHSLVHHYIPIPALTTCSSRATNRGETKMPLLRPVHVTGALLPHCSPCLEESAFEDYSKASTATVSKRVNPHTKDWSINGYGRSEPENSTTILFSPLPNMTASLTRDLIRGLALARSSLATYDDCDMDPMSCRNDVIDFSVVWLEEIDVDIADEANDHQNHANKVPLVLPPYISIEPSAGLLDSLARHPTTVAAFGHCTDESQIVANFGVSVLCISQSNGLPPLPNSNGNHGFVVESGISAATVSVLQEDGKINSHMMAAQLLGLLRQHLRLRNTQGVDKDHLSSDSKKSPTTTTITEPFPVTGMKHVVSLIRRVAMENHRNGPWSSIEDMQQGLASAATFDTTVPKTPSNVNNDNDLLIEESHEDQPYDTFTVLIAWLIISVSSVYITLKDSVWISSYTGWKSTRRSHYYHQHQHHYRDYHGISEGILTRLPDLDDAWTTLVQWYREQPSLHSEGIILTATNKAIYGASSLGSTSGALGGDSNNDGNGSTSRQSSGGNDFHNQGQYQNSNNNNQNANLRRRRKR